MEYFVAAYLIIALILWGTIRYDMGETGLPKMTEVVMMVFWPITLGWFIVDEYILN